MTVANLLPRLKPLARQLLETAAIPTPEWSIGIYEGAVPWHLEPASGTTNPVLTKDMVDDVSAAYVADPFMTYADHRWVMLFEVLNAGRGLGEIAFAESTDLVHWRYGGIALSEAFHLSYPHIVQAGDEAYLIPEAQETHTVRLYRADPFPQRFVFCGELLTGYPFADTTLVHEAGVWYLFTDTGGLDGFTLRLYCATELTGTWTEHPASPLYDNHPRFARPGGGIVRSDAGLVRFAQGCLPRYGTEVHALSIRALDTRTYAEAPISSRPVVGASGRTAWNGRGMHHIDAHQLDSGRWVACVDGYSKPAWMIDFNRRRP